MKSCFVGRSIYKLNSVDSTSNYAAKLLLKGTPNEGTAILAQFQESGRGQRGAKWQSSFGENLLVSFILYPEFVPVQFQFDISRVVSLSILDTLKSFEIGGLKIKWPNDILSNDRKISGILIENNLKGKKIESSLVGIGLNVNERDFHELKACSMYDYTNKNFKLDDVFNRLSDALEKRYSKLKYGNVESIRQEYDNHLYGSDESQEYRTVEKTLKGKVMGTTANGLLKLETGTGELQFNMKEISLQGY